MKERGNTWDREATRDEINEARRVMDIEGRVQARNWVRDAIRRGDPSDDLPKIEKILGEAISIDEYLKQEGDMEHRQLLERQLEGILLQLNQIPAWEPIWERYFVFKPPHSDDR
jgi:hypothetical protein